MHASGTRSEEGDYPARVRTDDVDRVMVLRGTTLFADVSPARHPRVAMTLLEHVASTSQWQTGMFLSLARRPLADRVILRLLDLAETSGAVETKRATTPRISQSTLAAMVGASRENVNRAVAVLAADGTLRVDRGRYVIADPDRVRRVIAGATTAADAPGSADP